MRKIGIMTFLHNENYGSLLQAYALEQALMDMGLNPMHLDYAPDRAEKLRNLLSSGNSPALVLEGIRKRQVQSAHPAAREKTAALAAFRRDELLLSPPCPTSAALARQASSCDILLCGSDQIWNPVWLNPAYFLAFGDKKTPRVAYAASLGVKEPPRGRKARLLRRLTAPFSAVSVREEEGAAILRALNPGLSVAVMPDPVFLLPRERWLSFAGEGGQGKGALMCYFIGDRPDYWQRAAALSAEKGLPLRIAPVTGEAFARIQAGEGQCGEASPRGWLRDLAGAAHLLTDSFHGAAFGAILGVPVTILRRYAEGDPESKNSRVDQLLRQLGAPGAETLLPCPQADAHLAALRERGLSWLRETLLPAGPAAAPGEATGS